MNNGTAAVLPGGFQGGRRGGVCGCMPIGANDFKQFQISRTKNLLLCLLSNHYKNLQG